MSNYIYVPNDNITIFDASVYVDGEYMGVTDEVVINLAEETKDFKNARGKKYQSINMVPEIGGSVKARDMTLKNLSRGLRAKATVIAASGAETETFAATFEAGRTVFLPYMYVSEVVVTKGGVAVDPSKYEVMAGHGGIKPIHADAYGEVEITFKKGEQTHLGLLNAASQVVRLEFVITKLHDDSPLRIGLWKSKFKAQKQLALAGNDYAAQDLEFTTLSDSTRASDPILGDMGYVMGRI